MNGVHWRRNWVMDSRHQATIWTGQMQGHSSHFRQDNEPPCLTIPPIFFPLPPILFIVLKSNNKILPLACPSPFSHLPCLPIYFPIFTCLLPFSGLPPPLVLPLPYFCFPYFSYPRYRFI